MRTVPLGSMLTTTAVGLEVLALEAWGSCTGMEAESTACVATMKMMSRTSMMSTRGVMLMAAMALRPPVSMEEPAMSGLPAGDGFQRGGDHQDA